MIAPQLRPVGDSNSDANPLPSVIKDHRPEIGDNLYSPVPGDHGAHGDFDTRSLSHSPELWLSLHRRAAALGIVASGTLAWVARTRLSPATGAQR